MTGVQTCALPIYDGSCLRDGGEQRQGAHQDQKQISCGALENGFIQWEGMLNFLRSFKKQRWYDLSMKARREMGAAGGRDRKNQANSDSSRLLHTIKLRIETVGMPGRRRRKLKTCCWCPAARPCPSTRWRFHRSPAHRNFAHAFRRPSKPAPTPGASK